MRTAIHCRSARGTRSPQRRFAHRLHRTAFSLVELLVSISIFVILSVIALSAFQGSSKDKITSGARQVQAVFNGAKSRAAKSGEPRGVRLLLDPADRKTVNALQYVGSASYHSGTIRVQVAESTVFDNTAPNINDLHPICRIVCEEAGDWGELLNQGLIRENTPLRIRIPNTSTGRWYNMVNINTATGVGNLSQIPLGAEWTDNVAYSTILNSAMLDPYIPAYQFQPSGPLATGIPRTSAPDYYSNTQPIPYLLRLEPQPLPNTTPINLPKGVVIDLDGSRLPDSWRQREDADRDGSLDAGEDFDGNGQLDFSANYAPTFPAGYATGPAPLDIMFSPNGTATGEFAALGSIFLTIAHVDDLELARPMRYVDATTTKYLALIPGDYVDSYGDVALFPNKERRAVAIYPLTGNVFISQVNGLSANGYRLADNPFSYAYAGRDSK